MNLTAAEHGDRPRLDRRLPGREDRFPNWRVVPLYVNFGTDSYSDDVELDGGASSTSGCARRRELPTTSQPTPGDFLAAYEELGAYERILSLHIAATLSGTFESAGTAARQLGDGRVRTIDSETASVAIAMLALAIQRRLERGTTDEEIDALVERYTREHGLLFTVDTLEFLARGGRIGKAKAFAGELLNVKPILSIRDGEVRPGQARARQPQGVPGVRRRARARHERRAGPAHRHRARRRAGADGRAREDGARPAAAGADRDRDGARRGDRRACRARAPSASSGSPTD